MHSPTPWSTTSCSLHRSKSWFVPLNVLLWGRLLFASVLKWFLIWKFLKKGCGAGLSFYKWELRQRLLNVTHWQRLALISRRKVLKYLDSLSQLTVSSLHTLSLSLSFFPLIINLISSSMLVPPPVSLTAVSTHHWTIKSSTQASVCSSAARPHAISEL